jgi:hypothetical protein
MRSLRIANASLASQTRTKMDLIELPRNRKRSMKAAAAAIARNWNVQHVKC